MNIENLIIEGQQIQICEEFQDAFKRYQLWTRKVLAVLEQKKVSQNQVGRIKLAMHYVESPFSEDENLRRLKGIIVNIMNDLKYTEEGEIDQKVYK